MEEKNELTVISDTESTELVPADQTKENRDYLKQQSQELLAQITKENNPEKVQALTDLFNTNHNKKAMIRTEALDDVMDNLVSTLKERIIKHPDHFPDEDLVKAISTIHGVMEKNAAMAKQTPEQAIQINNPEVTINNVTPTLNKESRDNVNKFMQGLISGKKQDTTVIDSTSVEEIKND